MGARRDALVTAAMELFAEHGYEGTSVADIQLAAGLTGGSGALYKHFPSKEAVLEAGIDAYFASLAARSRATVRELPSDPHAALQIIATSVIDSMVSNEAVIRVLLRDVRKHPALLDRLWNGVLSNVYEEMSHWLREQANQGTIVVSDPEAVAAVLMSSLTNWPILRALIGRTPGDLSSAAFIAAWVDMATRTLGLPSSR